ncbi:UDP-glucose 4-epimerase GalE [Salsipaludibacter albus]|uniref:UDP-glucose 4-epimerase GalE n=1 Tax=Salsipaludibacter albus TaxID=2849650 RepID=UPI001EE4B498|nr:UDP-glucose 4-epimerase GalE [Salsipaludibacter albus]MBY5163607.1 UDP-glucose 4-epimerase GalE [Salsipaludibacter albus]
MTESSRPPVLVTGGAGYIGSHTVAALRRAGRRVVVLDTLERGRRDAVVDAELVVGDVADRALVTELVERHGIREVVHFAAYKSVPESMDEPGMYFTNNVAGSIALVEAARDAGVTALVFSSSCSVVGNPPTVPVDEEAPIAPESVYAETKAMVERVLDWTGRTSDLQSVTLRYFNAAGAAMDGTLGEDWSSTTNLVPLVMRATITGSPTLQVYGTDYPTRDGTCIRDYIHVDDLARAHVLALDHLADGGATTVVNVGTGVGSTVREVLAATEAVAGRPVPHEEVGRRPGDPAATWASNDRARELLGFTPEHDLDDIIRSAWEWFSSHADQPA